MDTREKYEQTVSDLCDQISARRQERGMSIQAMSNKTGTQTPLLYKYFKGSARPNIVTLAAMAKAVGLRLNLNLTDLRKPKG